MSPSNPTREPPAVPAVVELRQYTLHPGRRDDLIELFEREFVESQEALGMRLIGQFRDLDDADCFVWLRGFASMATRRPALASFYGGPVWAAHRAAANTTMLDSDNVLLLRPAWRGAAPAPYAARRAPPGALALPAGAVALTVFPLAAAPGAEQLARCADELPTACATQGATWQAWYASEPSANDFPGLPVREGESVLVSVSLFPTLAALDAGRWRADATPPWLAAMLSGPVEARRLAPTARSALHA